MIEDKDIKIGLKFYLPIMRISGAKSDSEAYEFEIGDSSYYSSNEPFVPFEIVEIFDTYVICRRDGCLKGITVNKEILKQTGDLCKGVLASALKQCILMLLSDEKGRDKTMKKKQEVHEAYNSMGEVCCQTIKDIEQVEHPSHYAWLKEACGVEPIDICRHFDFSVGNALKYLMRKGKVDGDKTEVEKRVEDLRKAVFYLNDEIKRLEGGDED